LLPAPVGQARLASVKRSTSNPRSKVGWQTCLCLSAEQSGRRGHHTHTCEACHEEGYRTISYDPPHVVAVR